MFSARLKDMGFLAACGKERLPFNLLQTEYEQLTDPSRVFGALLQLEL